jgi:hypothetical protein
MITLIFWAIRYVVVPSGGTITKHRLGKAYRLKAER